MASSTARPNTTAPTIIASIAVEGAQRVEAETVRSYLLVREGDAFDPMRIDRSLKSLFATGLFADVKLSQEGSTLVVHVLENPVINRIAFEGNRRIDDAELAPEVSLKPRVIYTRSKVQSDVNRIQTLYQRSGRFAVTVEPKIIQLPQNRVDLVFEIDEGALTEVQNIRFIGNRVFDDGDLLDRSEEHTSELQSHHDLVCRLLLEKKKENEERSKYIVKQCRSTIKKR